MKLEYALQEEDFLQFHLYIGSNSENYDRSILFNRWIFASVLLLLSGWNYFQGGFFWAIYCGIIGVALMLFYPRFLKWRYERHYLRHIRQHYADRIGKTAQLSFTETHLVIKDASSEGKTLISDLQGLIELPERFLLHLPGGHYLNIPKRILSDPEQTKASILQLGIPYQDALDWKWL